MRVSDQGTQTRAASQPASRRIARTHARLLKRTPEGDVFHIRAPRKRGERFPLIADVENHLHGMSGCRRSASYSFFPIPDTVKEGCGGMRGNFRDTCRSPGYFCAPGCLLFPPPPLSPTNSSLHS